MTEPQPSHMLVIIPCCNESGRIGNVVSSVREIMPRAEVVVIDDASSDNSGEEALDAGATVLRHPSNLGYGASLETGYMYAVNNNCEIILQMDADGQHPAYELPRLLEPVQSGKADIVIGSRYRNNSGEPCVSPVRRFAHALISRLLFFLTGLRLSDPTSGFQALNRQSLSFFSSGVFPCDYPDSDVILMAHFAGLRIVETPVRMLPRAQGKSMHSGLSPFYYTLKMVLAMFIVLLNFNMWRRWRKSHSPAPGKSAQSRLEPQSDNITA